MPNDQVLQYLWFPVAPDPRLRPAYESAQVVQVQDYLESRFPALKGTFTVTSLPSLDWALETPEAADPTPVDHYVIPVQVDAFAIDHFRREIIGAEGESAIGADLSAGTGEYWCPRSIDQAVFGNRTQARSLIHTEDLKLNKLCGDRVNVVVVDHGLDKRFTPNFKGGWRHRNAFNHAEIHRPGLTIGDEAQHGRMMVRNILNAAPKANIWDMPLIPPRIWNIKVFISDAHAALDRMLLSIQHLSTHPQWSGPWVLVNAWAIFDRRSEQPVGDYTNRLTHPFNKAITYAVSQGRDVIFGAGNCGQFCPDGRCGPCDIGPGQSVLGANSHPGVISVGAVRVDALWLGYSSQGPGQPDMALTGQPKTREKPDLCAPSDFAETADAYTRNTGTSAATGVAAGVVAALRSRKEWDPGSVAPDVLHQILNATTRHTEGPEWNERLGNGILDARAAVQALMAAFP